MMRMGDVCSGFWNLETSDRVLKELDRYNYVLACQVSGFCQFQFYVSDLFIF